MYPKRSPVVFFLVALVVCAGLLAGCGGGQSGDGSQEQGDGGQNDQGGQKPAQESKIALGSVQAVNTEAKRFTVKSGAEQQGDEPIPFKITPQAKITLGGKKVELADMKKSQQVQVEYIVRKDLNRARSVQLFEAGGDGEKSGGGG